MEALTASAWLTLIALIGVCSLTFFMALRNWTRLSNRNAADHRTEEI